MILVLWKNKEYDFGFVKKRRVWFPKTVIFSIETHVNSIPLKCEKTTSMIYVLWKNNEYDFGFVKKKQV